MRLFIDTNVLCDALFDRQPWSPAAQIVLRSAKSGENTAIVSALTVANLYYVSRKLADATIALDAVRHCCSAFEIVPVDLAILHTATQMPGKDFEDNVQIAAATQTASDLIITRDAHGFAHSTIRVLSPTEFIQEMAAIAQGTEP